MTLRFLPRAVAAAALASLICSMHSHAGTLTLTSAGTQLGFGLSTFATLNPGTQNTTNFGPFGIGMDTTGGSNTVLVNNFANGTRYVFNDVDGQTRSTAIASVASSSGTVAYATAGGVTYGGNSGNSGPFVQFKKDGSVDHVLTGVTYQTYLGMSGNPVNGHIIASTPAGQLIDINPLANGGLGSARLIATPGTMDGVSVSPDGTKAVVEINGTVQIFDIASGTRVATYSAPSLSGVDGTGVISSNNALNGDIIAVTNFGLIVLIDPDGDDGMSAATFTTIASGGSRGDYSSPDVTNGTLFIDMSEAVYRLSCGVGCGIGTSVDPPTLPEPGSLALALTGLAGAALLRRKLNSAEPMAAVAG